MALSARELLLIVRAQDEASRTIRTIGSSLRGLGAAGSVAGRQLSESQIARRNFWKNIGQGAAVVGATGRATRNFGIVVAGSLGLAAKAYADFNEQASLAATQTGSAIGRTAQTITKNGRFIEKSILAQMKVFPASSKEMTAAAYDIYSSLDVSLNGGMKLLRQFNKASVAGMTPLVDVTNAGVSVMNAFRIPVEQMPRALARMFAGVRFGRMTFQEFTQSLNQIVPAFASADQSFDTMVGSLAFLTRLMPSVRMASTSLARLTEIVARKDFVEGMKKAGAPITDFKNRLLPLPEVIDRIGKRFPTLKRGGLDLQQFFKMITALGKSGPDKFAGTLKALRALGLKGGLEGTSQARRAFTHMLRQYELLQSIISRTSKDNQEFAQSYNNQVKSMGVRWRTFTNRVRSNILEVGRDSIPAIMEASKPLEKLLHWWESLSPATRKHYTQLLLWAGAAAIVAGTVATLLSGFIRLIAIFGAIGKLGPLALLGIVSALVGLSNGTIHVDNLTDSLGKLLDVLGKVGGGFLDFAGGGFTNFAVAAGIAAIAAGKLAKSQRAMRAGAGGGGLISKGTDALLAASLFSRGRKNAIVMSEETRAIQNRARSIRNLGTETARVSTRASKFTGLLKMAGTAAMALPGPLKLAAVAVAGLGIGTVLWKRHMQAVREEAEKMARTQKFIMDMTMRPVRTAQQFAGLGGAVSQLARRKNDLVILNAEIRRTQQELSKAPKQDKPVVQAQLNNLIQDRRDLMIAINSAIEISNQKFSRMTQYIRDQNANLSVQKNLHGQVRSLVAQRQQLFQKIAAAERRGGGLLDTVALTKMKNDARGLTEQIGRVNAQIRTLAAGSLQAGRTLRTGFGNAIRDFQRQGLLKFKIPPNAIQDALKFAIGKRGRMLTLPELQLFFKARLDPASIKGFKKLPKSMQEIVIWARVKYRREEAAAKKEATRLGKQFAIDTQQIKVKIAKPKIPDMNAILGRDFLAPTIKATVTAPNAAAEHSRVAKIFKQTLPQGVKVTDNGSGSALKQALAATFSSSITQTININTVRTTTFNTVGRPGGIATGDFAPLVANAENAATTVNEVFTDSMQAAGPDIAQTVDKTVSSALYIYKAPPSAKSAGTKTVDAILKAIAAKRGDIEKQSALTVEWFQGPWLTSDKFAARLEGVESPITQVLFQSKRLQKRISDIEGFDPAAFRKKKQSLADRIADVTGKIDPKYRRDLSKIEDVNKRAEAAYRQTIQLASRSRKLRALRKEYEALKPPKPLSPEDVVRDFQATSAQLVTFQKNMERLRNRNVPKELLQQLQELGVEGAAAIAQMAKMTDAQLNKAITAWKRGEAAAKAFAIAAEKLSMKDLIKDMEMQAAAMQKWNNNMQKLKRRGVPTEMLEQLRELGIEGAKELAILAGASEKELARYVAAWRKAQREAKRSQWQSVKDTKDLTADMRAELKAGFKNIIIEMYEFNRQAMGALFSGLEDIIARRQDMAASILGALDPFAGLDEFLSAQQESADELIRQQQEIADQIQAAKDRLQSEFGQLFTGSWLTGPEVQERIDWGQQLSMDDLKRDLREQVNAFKAWRTNLENLAKRGIPPELLKQLEELGIGASKNISILAGATDADLREYVNLWKEGQGAIGKAAQDTAIVLSETITKTLVPTIKDLTQVLMNNVTAISTWADDLLTLSQRGLPEELLQQLVAMGPQAAAAIHALATATGPELDKYIQMWVDGKNKLYQLSNQFIRGTTPDEVLANLRKQIEGFNKWQGTLTALAKRGVPLEVIMQLRELGPEAEPFLETLVSMTDDQLKEWIGLWGDAQEAITAATKAQFTQQLAMWRTHGQNVALQLIAGVMDEQDLLLAFFTDLFKNLLAGQSTTPGGIYSTGPNIPFGANDVVTGGAFNTTTPTGGAALPKHFVDAVVANSGTKNITINVTAHQDESLMSTLERARFRLENRNV